MRSLSVSRRSRGYGSDIPETVLLEEHGDGLSSEEHYVSSPRYAAHRLTLIQTLFRLTALFIATKTTNHPISLEAYANHIPKTLPSDVLDLEFLVAQSLGFDFAVWHAHRALWGIWLDIQVCDNPRLALWGSDILLPEPTGYSHR